MKKIFFILLTAVFLTGLGSAQESCEVIDAEDAELNGGEALEQGMTVGLDTAISTASSGSAAVACGNGVFVVESGKEGEIGEIAERQRAEVRPPENASIEDALGQTDEIEENLGQVNEALQEQIPSPLRSLILGDKVNFQVDNTTIGIKSNSSGITGVEDGGVEDPTLEISMEEDRIRNILESNNSAEEFRQAYEGEGVEVQAYSFRNKVIFGAVNLANRAYGLVESLTG